MVVDRERVLELLEDGKSPPFIAKVVGCKANTVHKIRKELADGGDFDPAGVNTDPVEDDEDDELEEFDAAIPGSAEAAEARNRVRTMKSRIAERRAELELKNIERQHEAFDTVNSPTSLLPQPTAPSSADPVLPVILRMMDAADRRAQQADERSQQMMLMLLERSAKSSSSSSLLGQVRELREAFDLMGSSDPPSTAESLMAAFAARMKQPPTAAGAPELTPAPSPPPAALPQAATPAVDLAAEARQRAGIYFSRLAGEMQHRSDPFAVADALDSLFGLLPEELRTAILTQPFEALVGVLGRYLAPEQLEQLVGLVRSSEQHQAWLGEFLRALHDDSEEEADTFASRELDGSPPQPAVVNGEEDGDTLQS